MPTIKVLPHDELCPSGKEIKVHDGVNLCKALLAGDVEIEHACDMSRACTTCHVIVRSGFNSLNEVDEIEEDLLDRAWGVTSQSRLSCQVIVNEDLTIEIPKYTINHAKEN
ncbi:MAG: ISC system 2Fe-2S type ferredoxin [Neisseriaceae bacterium]|nr:MAG: ISC system 2Fe-2S type ferredoxin [Neisseriaceae bacterium]